MSDYMENKKKRGRVELLVLAVARREGRKSLPYGCLSRPNSRTVDFILDEGHGGFLFGSVI